MDKDSREYIDNLVDVLTNMTDITKKLIVCFSISVCIMAVSLCIAICYSQKSSDDAMEECFRLYMETDYEYPTLDIEQSIDQEIGVK